MIVKLNRLGQAEWRDALHRVEGLGTKISVAQELDQAEGFRGGAVTLYKPVWPGRDARETVARQPGWGFQIVFPLKTLKDENLPKGLRHLVKRIVRLSVVRDAVEALQDWIKSHQGFSERQRDLSITELRDLLADISHRGYSWRLTASSSPAPAWRHAA